VENTCRKDVDPGKVLRRWRSLLYILAGPLPPPPFIFLNDTFNKTHKVIITSAKEVMFSYCLFVSRTTQNHSIDFHKIPWKGGTWAMDKINRFQW